MTTKQRKKPTRKKASPEEALIRYEEVFDEIRRFTTILTDNEEELREAETNAALAKAAYDAAKQVVSEIKDLREGARFGLIRFLTPDDGEVLPLFDRMESASEDVHGVNADQWRLEPIAALRLSLPAQMALNAADVMLVGQLQDRVLKNPDAWWESISGLNFGMSAAIVDLLNDFINDRSTR